MLALTVPAEVVLDAEPLVVAAVADATPEAADLVELPPDPLVPVAVEDAVAALASVAPVAVDAFDFDALLEEDCRALVMETRWSVLT